MSVQLGQLKNLKLKSVWSHEERDFTPWLASEGNLAALSDALGMGLQLERIEVPVGPYSADILARDASGDYAVIENQFGKTNHDHLGKLLTYGAVLGASIIVWIAEQFTDEHRKTIEWLNEQTTDTLSLYAVQLEVLQIDNSAPAIRFNIISQPNQAVRKANAVKAEGTLTDTQQLQLEFWTMFQKKLLEKKILPSTQTPRPQYWFDVALGRTNIHISNICDTFAGRIGVRIYIRKVIADAALRQLEKDRMAIEEEIGQKLTWNPSPEKQDKIIALFRDVDFSKRELWPEYCEWLAEHVAKVRKAFMPRVKLLKLEEMTPVQE